MPTADTRESISLTVLGDLSTPLTSAAAEAAAGGVVYWRSLNQLAETPEFQSFVEREFPQQASEWHDPVSRRNFLKLMGASVALAGVGAGCYKHPPEQIVPYVVPPEHNLPGRPIYFATAMPFNGYGLGLLAHSYSFRPTKIEGNPKHPSSLGATNAIAQASILNLYDPDRSQTLREGGQVGTKYSSFITSLNAFVQSKGGPEKLRLRLLTETITSPSLAAQVRAVLKRFPNAKWHQYQPVNNDNANGGAQIAFGRPVHAVYDFAKATRIVSLDSNFLQDDPGSVRYARDFVNGRRVRGGGTAGGHGATTLRREVAESKPVSEFKALEGEASMNRLYVVESMATITGAMADHRHGMRARDIGVFARALAAAVGAPGVSAGAAPAKSSAGFDFAKWVDEVAKDLKSVPPGSTLILAGRTQPPAVHALAHAMNVALGNVGSTVTLTEPAEAEPTNQTQSLIELTNVLKAGDADALFILGGNPAYDAPVDLDFATVLANYAKAGEAKQNFTVHLGSHYDETAFLCRWHVPQSHYLESWGDVRSYDGTVSIIQPLIAPLFGTQTPHDVLNALLGEVNVSAYEVVRKYWGGQPVMQGQDFEAVWQNALHEGFLANTAPAAVTPTLAPNFAAALGQAPAAGEDTGLEVVFRPDPHVWDGRFANNGWLQELPKPLSKLVWDNAAYMSYATAKRLLGEQFKKHNQEMPQMVRLKVGNLPERSFPVYVQFGHPDDSITVHLGFGRERAGRVGGQDGQTTGVNAYKLRTSAAPDFVSGVQLNLTSDVYPIATTQDHQVIDDERRDLIHHESLQTLQAKVAGGAHGHDDGKGHGKAHHLSLYPEYDYSAGHAWGMVIDQSACIGCNACVVACQSENNIPVVGKQEVLKGREMHWLRIDTYYGTSVQQVEHSLDNPDVYFQPMLCQHCEQAPCEVVCPVAATTHSTEGLNEMTYNRCVGTRYCQNNCPYKVRRFNFLQYVDRESPTLKLQRNPNVTVRNRGIMEKCTYCVQRINSTRIEEKKIVVQLEMAKEKHDDPTRARLEASLDELFNGLQTACQQACPTEAIVFGDINRKDSKGRPSEVARLREMELLNYGLLTELNTRPRTTYHAKVRNPNPSLRPPEEKNPQGHDTGSAARG